MWGGDTKDDAVNAGLDLWAEGGEADQRPDGFWIAPSHKSRDDHDEDSDDHEYTIEPKHAEWIPLC